MSNWPSGSLRPTPAPCARYKAARWTCSVEEARRLSRYGHAQPLPVIGGGDLNATASGSHLPQRDWTAASITHRRHKGIRGPDGTLGPDTNALD